MKHIFRLTSSLFLLTSYLLLLTSCEYKDLCYDHSHMKSVNVQFLWPKSEQTMVKGMTTLFYPAEQLSAEPVRYDFSGRDGGTARLTSGQYQVIAYNNDTETILYRGTSATGTLEAYTRLSSIEEGTQLTRAGMPRAAGTEEEPVILEPDPLWAASHKLLNLTSDGDSTVQMRTIPRVFLVNITITHVPNLQYTGQFGGALSGLAASVMMESGELSDEPATQAFTAQVVGDSTLEMRFHTFGHCPRRSQGDVNKHVLTIYAILADGTKWYYTMDVSEQMHDPAKNPEIHYDPKNPETLEITYDIDIDLEDLPVPKPIVNGSGFQPTIDGWQGVEIPVDM